jgi:hypothetical protein
MKQISGENFFYKYKKEIIMTAIFMLIAVISLLVITITASPGEYAEVSYRGDVIACYPLGTDGEFSILGGKNILIIKNGEAYMATADCPDKTCVITGKISRTGESIICLPNKVSVVIRGRITSKTPDLIS